jgi:hypothetical protein
VTLSASNTQPVNECGRVVKVKLRSMANCVVVAD